MDRSNTESCFIFVCSYCNIGLRSLDVSIFLNHLYWNKVGCKLQNRAVTIHISMFWYTQVTAEVENFVATLAWNIHLHSSSGNAVPF